MRSHVNTATLKQSTETGFPNFYLLTQITNQLDQLPIRFEQLRFLIYEDFGPNYTGARVGCAIYRRVVVLNAQHSTEKAKLVLVEQPYWIRYFCQPPNSPPCYSLVTELHEGPKLLFVSGEAGFSGGKIYTAKVGVDALTPTLLSFQNSSKEKELPLETVAGESLLKNPPKELLSLLIEQ